MKLIKPSTKIITPINGEEILKQIELAARTCYKSEGKIEYEEKLYEDDIYKGKGYFIAKSARVLIPKLIQRGHEAMLEFGGMITVLFVCDRGVSHELVRHRVGVSFAQESTRYCNYGKDEHIQFIIPCWYDIKEGIYNNITDFTQEEAISVGNWWSTMKFCENAYNGAIAKGESPQQARSVLPNSLKTEINISANIREWRHIFKLRTGSAAHPQMRELMCPLLDKFKQKIPILFDDINY